MAADVFDDGVLYDLEAQEWRPVPKGPFEGPLLGAAAAWTGHEFVVIGTPCAEPDVDQEDVDFIKCGTTQPVAAALDPATNRWSEVAVPDLSDLSPSGDAVFPKAIGSADGRAMFDVVPPSTVNGRQLVGLAPGATPQRIDPPPSGAGAVCRSTTGSSPSEPATTRWFRRRPARWTITKTWAYRDGVRVEVGGLVPVDDSDLRAPSAVG